MKATKGVGGVWHPQDGEDAQRAVKALAEALEDGGEGAEQFGVDLAKDGAHGGADERIGDIPHDVDSEARKSARGAVSVARQEVEVKELARLLVEDVAHGEDAARDLLGAHGAVGASLRVKLGGGLDVLG